MSFNGFVGTNGVDQYYGRNEYPNNDEDFDGLWGIFDEPYLQYFAEELNNKTEPFFSTLFTLSSHHPYTIPKQHIGKFPKGDLPLHETVGYTDYSLKRFFDSAQHMSWFKNTIFLFTADHSAASNGIEYNNRLEQFAIPLFIYDPTQKLRGANNNYIQHIDITPTILGLLGINDTIISFGNDAFDKEEKFVINYINSTYQIAQDEYFLQFDGKNTIGFYNTKNDSLLTQNLILDVIPEEQKSFKTKLENKLKAIIQQYNNRIISNQLTFNESK